MILMPRQSDKECIPSNQVFIFVVAVSSLTLLLLIKKMTLFLQAFLYWICWLHPGGNQCFHEHRQQCQQQQQQQEQQQQ